MTELHQKLEAYQRTMSLARILLDQGIISVEDYMEIDAIIDKKYGLNLCGLFS